MIVYQNNVSVEKRERIKEQIIEEAEADTRIWKKTEQKKKE